MNKDGYKQNQQNNMHCPDCGGDVQYYHSSAKYGDGLTRIVCKKKCQGWKIIKEINRNKEKGVMMKVRELTVEQLEKIVNIEPEWLADNRPEWMAANRPDLLAIHRPDLLAAIRPTWMADNRPDWLAAFRPTWMADNSPTLLADVPANILELLKEK